MLAKSYASETFNMLTSTILTPAFKGLLKMMLSVETLVHQGVWADLVLEESLGMAEDWAWHGLRQLSISKDQECGCTRTLLFCSC